jgi:tripartite-type tricarboxylate transporter receptor subunit TctC
MGRGYSGCQGSGPCKDRIKPIASVAVRVFFPAMLAGAGGAVWAQSPAVAYPSRPLHFIIPFPPGGSIDPMARLFAQKLSGKWGQPAVMDNRPGANTVIGSQFVARAAPDGHTLLVVGTPFAVNPHLFPLPYDTIRDFAPVATIARTRQILVVNPSLPVKSVQELVTLAKARPGQIAYSSSGTGNTNHLAAEILSSLTAIKLLHVPYKGAGPAVTDLIGGQVQISFQVPISVIAQVKSGRLRALAISGKTRVSALQQTPTFEEAGFPAFDIAGWSGLFAPGATPREIVDKISGEMARILAMPDIVDKLTSQAMEPMISTPSEFAAMIKSDLAKFAKVIKDANIKADQ